MLTKKTNLYYIFLICIVLQSCNNGINRNNINITEKKIPDYNTLISQNDNQTNKGNIQENISVENFDLTKNLKNDPKLEIINNSFMPLPEGYFDSKPKKETLESIDDQILNIPITNTKYNKSFIEKKEKFFDTQDIKTEYNNENTTDYANDFNDLDIIRNQDSQDEKAIIAALDMLSRKNDISIQQKKINSNVNKSFENIKQIDFSSNKLKIGVLIPLTGKNKIIGKEIMAGIENAHFSNFNNDTEIIFFDTNKIPENFFYMIENNKFDLIIGPVFTEKIKEINQVLKNINIPILSFSNNKNLNYKNLWLLGKMQEEEIENIIDFGIKMGVKKFAIFGDNTQYSKTLTKTAEEQINRIGLSKSIFIIENAILEDRSKLREKIKKITGWKKENNSKLTLPKAKYDGVLFTASKDFILQIAPLLSYYDLGPERAIFLGNSQFNNEQLIKELSLQGSFFSSSKEVEKLEFRKNWLVNWESEPSFLNILAHDITNFAKEIYIENNPLSYITRKEGHKWVTGQVFIKNNGISFREQSINKIENKALNQIYID
ncbi:MAG: hypothetical protein CMN37_09545 [SAR116 cluster bacterium]|nr:hypothetical protein [SAR116 cluster bacterium]